jgi:tripartite-type tricarboxylate transporter receptor subunit TctC
MRALRSKYFGAPEHECLRAKEFDTKSIKSWERTVVTKQILVGAIAAIGLGLNLIGQLAAQTYPTRPIKLITPNSPGSPPDLIARVVAQRLSTTLGSVIVDNRPGAGSTIGAKVVASAEPDGHTLLVGSVAALAIGPAILQVNYDAVQSFAPVAMVANFPFVLVVAPDMPVKTIHELVTYAKVNPGQLNYGAPNGSILHVVAELFKTATATNIVHVPYRNNNQAITDVMGGRIQMTFDAASVLLPFIAEGKLRAIAVTSATRTLQLPDVPTMIESGLLNFQAGAWVGILAPAGTSAGIVSKLNAEINAGLKSAEMRASLERLGAEATAGPPQEFAAFIAAESSKWSAVVKAANIKMD